MRVCGCVASLVVTIALAACASETPPLDAESVPLPRPAPKSVVTLQRSSPKSVVTPPRVSPKSLAQQSLAWRHFPRPVSDEELKLDQAKCGLAAKMASSSASLEMNPKRAFADCMRSRGYESI
jgi:hypothetical protein